MSNTRAFRELKRLAYEANLDLARRGLAMFTFGNVSAFDPGRGVLAIKPSGVPYNRLRPEDMVVVDLENRVVEGRLRPSSDTPTHTVLYQGFTDVRGVAHTHSPYAVSWAQAGKPIPVLGTTHADHLATEVPCTDTMDDRAVRGDYETETGKQIVRTFRRFDYRKTEMVLVSGHGPFTWGPSADQAVANSVILEELAKMALWTLCINPKAGRLKKSLVDRHYLRKHGKNATYGQPGDRPCDARKIH